MAVVGATITNLHTIEKALVDAFEEWAENDINKDHWEEQFKTSKWFYEGLTDRKNGAIVGSPRDIYDLGALYQSGVESFSLSKTSNSIAADWHWDAKNSSGIEYAWYVHEGTGTNATPRPFTDDISLPASFFLRTPGKALMQQVQNSLDQISR
jgi:hypothetical protein